MQDVRALTQKDDLEHGFWAFDVDEAIKPGPYLTGERNGLDVYMPIGQRPVGLVHSHPAGNPNPSRDDVDVYSTAQVQFGCIVTEDQTCCDTFNLTDAEWRELGAKIRAAPTYREGQRVLKTYRDSGKIGRCCRPATLAG